MQDNLLNIRQLPLPLLKKLDKLIVNRQGSGPESMMITRDIPGYISPKKHYQLVQHHNTMNLEKVELTPTQKPSSYNAIPEHTVIKGSWDSKASVFKTGANILGGMGSFIVNTNENIHIPVITATEEALHFYEATLLSKDSIIEFETQHDLPIVDILIGKHYVENYLSQEEYGGGEYIEYHDEPHLWIPMSTACSGHILLGKRKDETLYLTGFHIPFGQAIYMKPFTLHSDAYLVGHHLVVYTLTDNFSTVLFKHNSGELNRLRFLKNSCNHFIS